MPHEALRTILAVASWPDKLAAAVTFTGGTDPVLPTPFRIGVAGAATVAASGLEHFPLDMGHRPYPAWRK